MSNYYQFLALLAILLLATGSGCLSTSQDRCPVCGMPTDVYDGPKGKVVFENEEDIVFCSTADMFQILVQPGFNTKDLKTVLVQDTETAGWEKPVNHWIPAEEAYYVVGSDREAAMGGTFISFEEKHEAEQFTKQHGGTILRYDDIDSGTVKRYTRFE